VLKLIRRLAFLTVIAIGGIVIAALFVIVLGAVIRAM
jgi:hypothetical protein